MNTQHPEPESDISRDLGLAGGGKGRGRKWRWLALVLLVLALAAAWWLWGWNSSGGQVVYVTKPAKTGDLTKIVTATGNLEPINQVDVGSELSGIVKSVEVDFNDKVTKGQVLARLDTSRLESQVMQYKASLDAARAKLLEAQATTRETEVNLGRLRRLHEASKGKMPAQHELEAAEASLARAKAAEANAKAAIAQAQANLKTYETDLAKTVIRSPIDGVVLKRAVEPGQTVAASLQAPVLFTLAEDLSQMELHVDVDEADVGLVRQGQEAVFTVSAYPGRRFPASIEQVRFGAENESGVVTYETVLSLNNSDLSLRPGMTATADITVSKVTGALLIPNAALRFTPPVPAEEGEAKTPFMRNLMPFPRRQTTKEAGRKREAGSKAVLWTLDGQGQLQPVNVILGLSDGINTVVTKGPLTAGAKVVVGMVEKKK